MFTKHAESPRAAGWEAAGLRWLAAADAVPVVRVESVDDGTLILEKLKPTTPSNSAAEVFGRGLAALHDAGADAFGAGPADWEGDGYLGPSDDLLPLRLGTWAAWGAYYADACLLPTAAVAAERGSFPGEGRRLLDQVCQRLHDGEFDDVEPPARIHGDLWSGNVVWTSAGATLIDPAAHGGHRLTDLALLGLFGFPALDTVLDAYAEAHPLAENWHRLIPLHRAHHLLVHCACFGGGYVAQTLDVLRIYA